MKTIFLTAITLVTCGNLAQASGIPTALSNLIGKETRNAMSDASLLNTSEPGKCSEFAGTWSGTCSNSKGEIKQVKFTVEQDGCKKVKLLGDSVSISENALGAAAVEGFFAAATWSVRFNNGGRALMVQAGFSVDEKSLAAPLGGRVSLSMTRDADLLKMRGIVHTWLALQDVTKEDFDCTLQKQ